MVFQMVGWVHKIWAQGFSHLASRYVPPSQMPSWVGRLTLVRGWQGWLAGMAVSSGKRFADIDSHKMLFETPSCLNGSCLGTSVRIISRCLIFRWPGDLVWGYHPFGHPSFWEMISMEQRVAPPDSTMSPSLSSLPISSKEAYNLPMGQISHMIRSSANGAPGVQHEIVVFLEWWNFGFEEAENPKFRNGLFVVLKFSLFGS